MTSRFGREEQLRRLCILVVDRESSLMLASMIENEIEARLEDVVRFFDKRVVV